MLSPPRPLLKVARLLRGGVKKPIRYNILPVAAASSFRWTDTSANENGRGVGWSGILLSIGLCTLGYWISKKQLSKNNVTASSFVIPTIRCFKDEKPSRRFNFLAETVEKVLPSVVSIECQNVVPLLFGGETIAMSGGSGFIVDKDGYVLTNAHVISRRMKSVTVKLQNGRQLGGTVTDIDEVTDLALIKLDLKKGETLPALEFGSSADVRPGEWVIALGSPLLLSNSITSGIVSSAHRPSSDMGLQNQKPDMEYVQTDAAITVGNSGGPLVNLDGEVIGINTMTAHPGISFAIPSAFAQEFLRKAKKQLKNTNKRYGIGVSILTITANIRPHLQYRTNYNISNGVLIVEVWKGSPAYKAGLKKNDIIVKMNSKPIHSTTEIFKKVSSGETIELEVIRENEKKFINVKPEPLY